MKNLRVELQEHRVNAMERISRARASIQRGNQKTAQFCDYCHKNGHTLRWCRKKLRDEEPQRVQNYMSSDDKCSPTQDYGTSDFSRRPQCDSNMSTSLNLDDENRAKNAPLACDEAIWQHETNEFTLHEPEVPSRNNRMSFKKAQFNSAEETHDELTDPLPLRY